MGGAVLIILAVYGILWLVAIVGGSIMLFYIVRSLLKQDWLMACLQIGFAVLLIFPAPAAGYYLHRTFDAADKARREEDAREKARRDADVQSLGQQRSTVPPPTSSDGYLEQARREIAEQKRLREQRRARQTPETNP